MKASEMQVGTRIQMGEDEDVEKGVVIGNALKDGDEVIAVEWDNGSLGKVNVNDVQPEEDSLEQEFREVAESIGNQIYTLLQDARAKVKQAVELSEQHGIPFNASVSLLGNTYYPRTFEEKWGELDRYLVYDLTKAYNEYGDAGWSHSAVC